MLQVASAWQRPFLTPDFGPGNLNDPWGARVTKTLRETLPCWEWPLVSLFPDGIVPSPELVNWAVGFGSDALWNEFIKQTSRKIIAEWSVIPETGSLRYGSELLLTKLLTKSRPEVVRKLVASGLDINARDSSGNTSLHCVSSASHATTLLELGASTDIVDAQGLTAPQAWAARAFTSSGQGLHKLTEVLAKARPQAIASPHQHLFHMVIDAKIEDIQAAGWASVVAADPPITNMDHAGHAWGLLGQVGRTLGNSLVHERRIDLLESLLISRTPTPLWMHQSISGCDDLIFVAILACRHPLRKLASSRLQRSVRLAYPTEEQWASAFMKSVDAWRSDKALEKTSLRWDASLLFSALSGAAPFSSHPGWWQRLSSEDTLKLVEWVAEGILAHGRSYSVQGDLATLWDKMEQEGNLEGLKPWLPVLVVLTYVDIHNRHNIVGGGFRSISVSSKVKSEARLASWGTLGLNIHEALLELMGKEGLSLEKSPILKEKMNILCMATSLEQDLPSSLVQKSRNRM